MPLESSKSRHGTAVAVMSVMISQARNRRLVAGAIVLWLAAILAPSLPAAPQERCADEGHHCARMLALECGCCNNGTASAAEVAPLLTAKGSLHAAGAARSDHPALVDIALTAQASLPKPAFTTTSADSPPTLDRPVLYSVLLL